MPDLRETLGYKYLQETKFDRQTIFSTQRPQVSYTETFKKYGGKEKIQLHPKPDTRQDDLWRVFQQRRSNRDYAKADINREDLSLLLWASQGITAQAGAHFFRTAPSAGALYPIETYLAVNRVDDVMPGLYHYDVREMAIVCLSSSPSANEVANAALAQDFLRSASVVFIWSALIRRTISKYGHRGMRYVFMDSGHICQNLLLAAEALGLDACPIGAFYDKECNDLLGLDGEEESVIYLAAVGTRT